MRALRVHALVLVTCGPARVPLPGGVPARSRVVVALLSLGAEVTSVDESTGRYTARTPLSWWSWGETLVVQISEDACTAVAEVSGHPRWRGAVLDHGRGRRNVERVARALTDAP